MTKENYNWKEGFFEIRYRPVNSNENKFIVSYKIHSESDLEIIKGAIIALEEIRKKGRSEE